MKKTTPAPTNGESKIFTFIFQNIEVFLLVFTGFLVYSIYNLFTAHVSKHAVFVAEPERITFASMLIFGLMATEMLLALATSYFRKNGEWGKSVLVTLIALVIAYFNHLSIIEIFKDLGEEASDAVRLKVLLTNWLIFALGEIISLLMNSKGKEQAEQAPSWFVHFWQNQQTASPTHYNGLVDTTGNPITAQHEPAPQARQVPIGFQFSMKNETPKQTQPANRKPRGKSIDYDRVSELLDRGITAKEIAKIMNCTDSIIHKFKRERKA